MSISINGYTLYVPTSGGKAGKGHNKTGTVQVRKNNMIVKQVRFKTDSAESFKKAMEKAKDFATNPPAANWEKGVPRRNTITGSQEF